MAIRYAVANGVWSNTATWNGGTLPTSADDVFANNFTVTVDQDITAITLRSTSNTSPAITQGGQFVVTGNTGTRNITLTGTRSGSSFTNSGTWNGNNFTLIISATSGATVNLSYPTGLPASNVGCGSNITGNAIINYVGIIQQALAFGVSFRIDNTAAGGTFNVVGNPIGNSVEAPWVHNSASNYAINVIGNVIGGGAAANGEPNGIRLNAATIVNITGNIIGGTQTNSAGIGCTNSGSTINITGNVLAATAPGIINGNNNTITINGNISSSSSNNGITSTNTSAIITVNGNLINTNNFMAVFCPKLRISPTSQQTWTFQTGSGNRQLLTTNAFTDYPSVNDVRFGVSYANGSLTGTCYVPSPNSVAFGVPVDNTTGTAVLTRAQLISDVGAIVAAYTI